ncbi:hypothetical protein B0H65DRAFT_96157 [Neurospora tetraspora]|uniref:Uncharacterized protein n=1 Tax=Neurospora tetraspora TaxID=94610 RepID=A0AAE0JJ88_9PEZI|nr:hypothetical protein B0H65DRAFT_96157 [Neurospora tetraspora]
MCPSCRRRLSAFINFIIPPCLVQLCPGLVHHFKFLESLLAKLSRQPTVSESDKLIPYAANLFPWKPLMTNCWRLGGGRLNREGFSLNICHHSVMITTSTLERLAIRIYDSLDLCIWSTWSCSGQGALFDRHQKPPDDSRDDSRMIKHGRHGARHPQTPLP